MRKANIVLLLLSIITTVTTMGQSNNDHLKLEGRWDMTITVDGKPAPSWLEILHSGGKRLVGSYVGITGSARPISLTYYNEGKINFTLPPQWEEEDNDLAFEGRFDADKLSGTMKAANGKSYEWTAVRAPLLRRDKAPVWGKEIKLLGQNDMNQWTALGENQWKVENGILKSDRSGANLITKEKYNDFKLHIEFRYPEGSNSGIYLRGRYEVQIQDDMGKQPEKHLFAGVYGFLTPNEMAAKPAGEWQTYDITLVGRMINIVANGKHVICNQEIPGITGGALDSNEGEPGPIMIQGDHGPVEYRNIVITPTK